MPADLGGEPVHRLLHNARTGHIVGIHAFTGLEIHVGVVGRATDEGMLRRKRTLPVCSHQGVIDHGLQIFTRQLFDLVDLVRGAESIKEVQERNTGLKSSCVRDQGQVLRFLRRV